MVKAFCSAARQMVIAPPPAGPLIHGSTTPMANDVATAASIASPPASNTVAPTSAARRCCAATIPRDVGMTALRTICVREKLSALIGSPPLCIGLCRALTNPSFASGTALRGRADLAREVERERRFPGHEPGELGRRHSHPFEAERIELFFDVRLSERLHHLAV